MHLYIWNTAISAALYVPIQGLEIALRNTLQEALVASHGSDWYDKLPRNLTDKWQAMVPPHRRRRRRGANPSIQGLEQEVIQAKSKLQRKRKTVSASAIVPELTFGFWVMLLHSGTDGIFQETLWRPIFSKALPTIGRSKMIHTPLVDIKELRNRIAHHEPIFNRDLQGEYDKIIRVLSWIDPDVSAWVDHHNIVKETMNQRP